MSTKLLCVTEKPQTKQNLFDSLVGNGYHVDVATDRQEATDLAQQRDYDVAVVDAQVQRDTGVEIFRAIERRQDQVQGILCCAEAPAAHIEGAITAGVKHVLAKPAHIDELVSLIGGAVRESSRSFDERYPHVGQGLSTEEGVVRGDPAPCESCSRTTHWVHKQLGFAFCSADCLSRYLSLHHF